jgi:nicotinamide-nucleotide amidase
MLARLVAGPLSERAGPLRIHRRVLRVAGRTESHVEESIKPAYERWRAARLPLETTILAAPGQIELHLTAEAADPDEGRAILAAAERDLLAILGRAVFSTDGRSLEEVVVDRLRERRIRIALAESCTGGLATSRLTDVPGSSASLEMSVVCYSNRAKQELLGIAPELIAAHGAVSEPVAAAMARAVRDRAGVEIGVGVTGIAGPSGGSERKPVGTVAVAVSTATTEVVRTFQVPGGRQQVKFQASQLALDLVRRVLEDGG